MTLSVNKSNHQSTLNLNSHPGALSDWVIQEHFFSHDSPPWHPKIARVYVTAVSRTKKNVHALFVFLQIRMSRWYDCLISNRYAWEASPREVIKVAYHYNAHVYVNLQMCKQMPKISLIRAHRGMDSSSDVLDWGVYEYSGLTQCKLTWVN